MSETCRKSTSKIFKLKFNSTTKEEPHLLQYLTAQVKMLREHELIFFQSTFEKLTLIY